jgi:transposase InsO family protein
MFRVKKMCQVLEVSRSGYYYWLEYPISQRKKKDIQLKEEIRRIYDKSRKRYGSPRIHQKLLRGGYPIGRKRVARLMQELGIQAVAKRKYKATTDSTHSKPVADNYLNRNFTPNRPNTSWVADITYIWTLEGWLYLATIMDLFSRKIISWSLRDRLTKELVIAALDMAVKQRNLSPDLLIHSDRGSQYTSELYQLHLLKHGILCSMSGKGNCWDNAVMESFYRTLKVELIYQNHYQTRREAQRDIFEYIEVFYNRERLHSSLGYYSPEEYEALMLEKVS